MEVLFTFLAERYEKKSVVITSNLVFSQWDQIFKDPMTTMAAIDRLVHMALARGVDTVINLGAGLDTRPYRMDLPPSLRWIEIDFPQVLDYKRARLAEDEPICDLQRIPADLSRDADRQELFARLGAETRQALTLSEGVVGYLSNAQNARLSRDLFAVPSFAYWVLDFLRGRLSRIRRCARSRRSPWSCRSRARSRVCTTSRPTSGNRCRRGLSRDRSRCRRRPRPSARTARRRRRGARRCRRTA